MTDSHQTEAQAISEPIVEEAISRMVNSGLTGPQIAQSLILTGAGLLAGTLGPKGAGHDIRAISAKIAGWMEEVARNLERNDH